MTKKLEPEKRNLRKGNPPKDWIKIICCADGGRYYLYEKDKCLYRDKEGTVTTIPKYVKPSNDFDSWHDTSTGETIDTRDKMHALDKQGLVRMTPGEAKREAEKNMHWIQNASRTKERKEFERALIQAANGELRITR